MIIELFSFDRGNLCLGRIVDSRVELSISNCCDRDDNENSGDRDDDKNSGDRDDNENSGDCDDDENSGDAFYLRQD